MIRLIGAETGPDDARRRAVVAVSVFIGHLQLARAAPDLLPSRDAWQQHVDDLADMLLS